MSQANRSANNVEPIFYSISHYDSPDDVLHDAGLSIEEKRVILSSWASDMYVVESHPTLREIPGIPHKLHLKDILNALKRLDDDTDPPAPRGLAMRPPRFSKLDCKASVAAQQVVDWRAATRRLGSMPTSRPQSPSRWTREANVQRYRKLLSTQLTELERSFVERRLAEEERGCSAPYATMEEINVRQL
jgi:hypothetical protein